jgi:uncharacterized membrane protein
MKELSRTRFLCETALIAAIYAALTLLLAPISYGPIQMRVSEALCVLPFFTPAGVPGLFIGCVLANLYTIGLGPLDIIFGSLATLIAAFLTWKIRNKNKWLLPLPSVLVNAFIVGWVLTVQYGISYPFNVLTVGAGQAIACYVIGMPLWFLLNRYRNTIFKRNETRN